MDEMLLRFDVCDCCADRLRIDGLRDHPVFFDFGGFAGTTEYHGASFACPKCGHICTVEVLNVQVVECKECSGTGNGEEAVGETETGDLLFVECPACLGSGLRLVGCRPSPQGSRRKEDR